MPQGIGYGPLPPPPGFSAAPGLPRITPAPPVDLALLAPPQPQPVIPTELMPAPVLPEEPQQLPAPLGMAQDQTPDLGARLRALLGLDTDTAAPAAPITTKPTGTPAPQAGAAPSPDPRDPIALAKAGADARVTAEQATLGEMRQADAAIKKAYENQQKREAERAERERVARENVAKQNAQIQQALKAGPGTTWRDVAATGIQIAGAVLGAAFDRSGALQKNLPNLLQAYVQQGQERTQAAFARQLQALQVGREGARDELEAAMDDERRIEAAGAAARQAIAEESLRQIQIAAQKGRVDMAEIEAKGLPQQLEAMAAEAAAKRAKLLEEEQRSLQMHNAKIGQIQADTAKTKAERAQGWARITLDREKQRLEEKRFQAQSEQERLDRQKKELDILKEQGLINDRDLAKAVPLPGGAVLIANDAERAREFSSQIASAEILGGLLDRIAVKLETGTDQFWASPEAQRLLSDYNAAVLATKDAEVLGAIQGADMGLIEGGLGPDPSKISLSNLRSQAPRIRQTRDNLGRKINARARAISSKWAADKTVIELPSYEDPKGAVPPASEAVKALLPGVAGQRPKLAPDGTKAKNVVTSSEYGGAVNTLRETIAAEIGRGERRDELFSDQPLGEDDIVRVQATELAGALKAMRAERQRLEQDRAQVQQDARGRGPESTAQLKRAQDLTSEIATVQQYEQRLGKELERERRLLYQRIRGGDPRAKRNVNPADQAAYDAVAGLIGGL